MEINNDQFNRMQALDQISNDPANDFSSVKKHDNHKKLDWHAEIEERNRKHDKEDLELYGKKIHYSNNR